LERTTLNNDLEKSIEGIVFRFGKEDENEPVLAKMVDPVFTELAKTKYAQRKENKPSDFLGITVLDVMNFILEKGVDSFEVEGKSEDEKYLSFMSDVFVNFLDENSEKYKEADFDEPQYLKKDEFRVNKDMVSNRAALKYIEEDDAFESLFKLIINQFRKIKKRTGGIINQNVIEQFNSVVKNIEDRIGRKDKINESVLPSFRDFKDQFRKKVDYITEENDDDGLENYGIVPDGSFDDFITDLDTIEKTPVENKMPLREFKEDPSLTPTNIIVGRFQPFHNGHLNMAKQLKEKNGITSMAVVVYPGHNKSGKSPFKEEIIRKYMESVVRDNPDYLNSFLIVTKGLLGIIAGEARKRGYRIELIGAGDDRSEDFEKQVDYLKKAGKEFPDDAKVFQTKRMIKGADARKHIERDDFTAFKKMVPPGVSSIYPVLSSAIKGTDVTNESESEFDFEKNIRKIYENISTFDFDSFSEKELDQKKIKKILAKARSAEVLLKSLLNENYISENLFENLRLSFFGKSYGANINQNEYIEEFVSSVSESTIENLSKRIEGNFENDLISFDSVLEAGSLDINQLSNFNGIDRSDLQEIYAMDSRFPSGRKRRGKGESLTAIAFGGKHYYEIEADVLIEGIRVEVKTTINSGIDAENEANKIDSKIIEAFKLFSEYLGENKELLENKMQKNTLDLITSKLSSDTAKSRNSIIGKLKKILEFKDIKEASDVGPALICRQLNWYSESQGFDVLAIYAEREGFPEKLMLLDGRKGFMNPKNLSILKENNVNPKVIQGRMEIYKTI
jgi:cytidyltransferase-like protein